jgi:integrative and conjugative element protein (TIGR02256 family)
MAATTPTPGDFHLSTDDASQTLVFTRDALAMMLQHRQLGSTEPESGGMLFAQIEPGWITVRVATPPHRHDHRLRHAYEPDLKQQQREIRRRFKEGLHFIGEWHTHPEARPQPSGTDLHSMARCFATSRHSLRAFVMVILGTAKWPDGLWVSLHRENSITRLHPGKSAGLIRWLGAGWFTPFTASRRSPNPKKK